MCTEAELKLLFRHDNMSNPGEFWMDLSDICVDIVLSECVKIATV